MRKAIVYLLVGLVIITVISLFTLTGPIARYAVQTTFEPQKLTLSDSTDISYDPFVNELTIKDLTLLHEKNNELLKLDKLVLEIDVLPLFRKRLQINSFELFGLETSIKQVVVGDKKAVNVSPEWLINGWSTSNLLSKSESPDAMAGDNPDDKNQDGEKPAMFKEIVIENLQFENINLSAELPTQSHQLSLNRLSLSEFSLLFDESSQISDLQFELSTRFKSQNTLELEDDQFFNLGTNLTLEMKPVISFSEQDISISNEQPIELTVNELNTDYKAQDINASLANFTMSLSDFSTVISQNKPSDGANASDSNDAGDSATQATTAIDLDANLEWAIEDLVVNSFDKSVEIFSLGNARIEPASVSFNNAKNVALPAYSFKTSTFELQDLSLMKFLENNKPTLSVLEKLVVTDINVSSERVALGLVQVGKLNNNILINEAKELANLYLPNQSIANEVKEEALGEFVDQADAESNTDKQVEDEAQQSEEKQVPNDVSSETPSDGKEASKHSTSTSGTIPFQLKEVVNIAPITLNTVDMSVSPIYRSLLEVSYFSLQNVDSQSPQQKASLTINATNNKYAKIDVNAQSQPFAVTPQHDIQIDLAEIDMASISPYISGALGYHINSGQMDSQVTAQIVGDKIDGNADLLLRTMDLTAISDEGQESSISGGAISFNYALGMLKDGDGNVDLSVPFSGDLNNPSVGFSGFLSLIVKRATMSAAKDYLINTFVPYANVVNFALSASKHILKLRFNDLEFTPKQTELSDSQKDTLSQLAQVLNKHESVTIKICAISNPSDLGNESPVDETSQSQADSPVSQVTAKSISANQVSTLLSLAQDRANQVKSYLVNEGEVASKRLSSCSPTISYEVENAPKVTFDQIN